ncbi:MAG: M48 family metallopeptidase [Cyanobacteriota bacterium]|nr:M48 family metallopeptidase [Cyanobacteriota bacterium]
MLQRYFASLWRSQRRWLYGLLAMVTALSLTLSVPQATQAISWWEILLRGAQILQLSTISDNQEVQLGGQINQQISSRLRRQGTPLSSHREATEYFERIGQRLAAVSDRTDIPYTFQIVEDRAINAFATMGGFVYINAGLMYEAENEAELAGVAAHEIGHIVERHAIQQMRQRAIAQGLLSAAGLDESTAIQLGVELALNLPHSRGDEFEADAIGLEILRRAGYAPSAMVSFLKKLQREGSPPPFLSTHPAVSDRINTLERLIAENPPTANEVDGLDTVAYRNRLRSFAR